MEATIFNAAGTAFRLPTLLGWDISHGFCSPCDSFAVEFLYERSMLDALKGACRFQAVHGGETVFFGVVDEFDLSADRGGCVCALRGRGLQALLLDSEAERADYYCADTEFILRRHAAACGLTDLDAHGLERRSASLSVSSGESHWSVVRRFAEFCLGVQPRFSPSGRLLLDGADSGRRFTVDGRTPVTAQTYVQDRYGVISRVLVKNRTRYSGTVTVDNPEFQAIGGNCVRVVSVPRRTGLDGMRHTGAYQIRKSRENFVRCRLTLPECFAAFPGDRLELETTPLGIHGSFRVVSSRCFADGKQAGTVLDLREI